MNPRTYWNDYVQTHGGPTGVAARLSIPYSTIAGICNGSRGIGRNLATRMAKRDPALDPTVLVWVSAEKGNDPQEGRLA